MLLLREHDALTPTGASPLPSFQHITCCFHLLLLKALSAALAASSLLEFKNLHHSHPHAGNSQFPEPLLILKLVHLTLLFFFLFPMQFLT